MNGRVVIEFHLDARSGVSPYQQIVQQVRQALRLGLLSEGEQLPTVKDVVARLAINPNTVLKAYKELEHAGLVAARPGVGTFVMKTLSDGSLAAHGPLRQELNRWFAKARRAGLDDESIEALFRDCFRSSSAEGVALTPYWKRTTWARGTGGAGPCLTATCTFRPGGWPLWSGRTELERRPCCNLRSVCSRRHRVRS